MAVQIGLASEQAKSEALLEALEQLDAEDFTAREHATRALWEAGDAAEPHLRDAMGHPSIEVRVRAQRVLQLLRYGLDPNASPRQWELVQRFFSSTPDEQAMVLFQKLGEGSTKDALQLLEASRGSRSYLIAQLDNQLERLLPKLILDDEMDEARRVVDLLASNGRQLRYAAWFHYLNGSIESATEQLRMLPNLDATAARRLRFLLAAQGDDEAVSRLIEEHALPDSDIGSLVGSVAPSDYAKRLLASTKDKVEVLGLEAAVARFSGNDALFAESMKLLQRVGARERTETLFCLEAMVINGDLDTAVKAAPIAIEPFRLRSRQRDIAGALALVGITKQTPPFSPWIENVCRQIASTRKLTARRELLMYPYAVAELCLELGEREEAIRICRLTADALMKADRLGFQDAIRQESELGLNALAMEHAQQALEIGTPEISVFLGLFGKENAHARNWFDFLRQRDRGQLDGDPGQLLERLQWIAALIRPDAQVDTDIQDGLKTLVREATTAANPVRGTRKKTWPGTVAYSASLYDVPLPEGFMAAAAVDTASAAQANPSVEEETPGIPMATRVLGRPGFVLSPHGIGWLINTAGMPPGTVQTCPHSGKKFRVPPPLEQELSFRPSLSGNARTLLQTGEVHLEAGRIDEAIRAFSSAVNQSKPHTPPKLLYLLGTALEASGKAEAGALRKRQARLLAPLTGNRLNFIEFLWTRGERLLVSEECRFIELHDAADGTDLDDDREVFRTIAKFLTDSDPLRAADLLEMDLLASLKKKHGARLIDHVEARFIVHQTRAKGLIALGDPTTAIQQLQKAAAMLPADARVAETVLPLSDHPDPEIQSAAIALTESIRTKAASAAMQFPNSPTLADNLKRIEAVASSQVGQLQPAE